jgi:hypothetical protein
MSDLEPSIFCDFQQSKVNSNLYICKYCNTVMNIKDKKFGQNLICSYRLDRVAMDPRFDQVKLVKTTVETTEGEKIAEYDHNPELIKQSKILDEWWFGSILEQQNTIAHINQKNKISSDSINFQTSNNANHCTQDQIDNRLSICETCEFYKNNTCLKCGCSLSRERNFMNKLYWKDKSCPIGKWGPVV